MPAYLQACRDSVKTRVFVDDRMARESASGVALHAIFQLQPLPESASDCDGGVIMLCVRGAEAAMVLIRRCFMLNNPDMHVMAKLFSAAACLACGGISFFEIAYKHDYALLPAVRNALCRALALGARAENDAETVSVALDVDRCEEKM